mgnify:CR=1 FL=1
MMVAQSSEIKTQNFSGLIPFEPNQYMTTRGGGYCKWVLLSGFECKFNFTKGP